MKKYLKAILFLACSTLVISQASAHFIWAQMRDNKVEFLFTDGPWERTSDRLLPKMEGLTAMVGFKKPLSLQMQEDCMAGSLGAGDHVAGGHYVYGIYQHGDQKYLLDYYVKAANDIASAKKPVGLDLEVFAERKGEEVLVTVLSGGQLVSGAEVMVNLASSYNDITGETDDKGQFAFDLPADVAFGVRAMMAKQESGTHDGQEYKQIHCYSTLTVADNNAAEANKLLLEARAKRECLPENVQLVRGEFELIEADRKAKGSFTFDVNEGIEVELDGVSEDTVDWVHGQIGNLFGHRIAPQNREKIGGPLVTLTGEDGPLGTQLILHDGMKSSYRIRDKEIVEVTRTMGEMRFTITVMESMHTDRGTYLPTQFAVSYFDSKSNELSGAEYFTDEYQLVGNAWLPARRRVVTTGKGDLSAKELVFKGLTVPGS